MSKFKIILSTILIFLVSILILFVVLIQDSQNEFTLKIKSKVPKNYRWHLKAVVNEYLNFAGANFEFISEEKVKTSKKINIKIKEFNNKYLDYQGPRSYISANKDDLYLVSGTGLLFHTKIENLYSYNENIKLKPIKTNLKKVIEFKDVFKNSNYGIKGMMISGENIYLSFSNLVNDDCINVSVLKGKIHKKKINFSYIFKPEDCVKRDNEYGEFQPIQSGGALHNFDKNHFLLSTGEFRYRLLAQKDDSMFGKILKINKNNGEYSIVSKGHRNIQGMYFDDKNKIILSTEHGPKGGDEVNINKNIDGLTNFGWPISSYGEHYPGMVPESAYEKAPLHKSHELYGFQEPIKYFVPSIGITQIVKAPFSFGQFTQNNYFFASMGYEDRENALSIHQIVFNDRFDKILFEDKIKLRERVRDLLFIEDKKSILAYLEKKGSLLLINLDE